MAGRRPLGKPHRAGSPFDPARFRDMSQSLPSEITMSPLCIVR